MILKFNPDIFHAKRDAEGEVIVVLDGARDDRKLKVENHYARSLKKYDIHEVIVTDEDGIELGGEVNKIGYICFFEVLQGGHIILGDGLYIAGRLIGKVVGFDDIHMPNHMNIIIQSHDRRSAKERGVVLGDMVSIGTVRKK